MAMEGIAQPESIRVDEDIFLVEEIYSYNTASQRAFEAAGFRPVGETC